MFGNMPPSERDALIAKIKAAEPPGGYKDIKTIWYLLYLFTTLVIIIVGVYYLSDTFLGVIPTEGLVFLILTPLLLLGIFLLRSYNKRHNA